MIILAIILPPILFWAVIIAWIECKEKKKRRERKTLNRRRQ